MFEEENKADEILSCFAMEEFELFFRANHTVDYIATTKELYGKMAESGTWLYTNGIKYNDLIRMKIRY